MKKGILGILCILAILLVNDANGSGGYTGIDGGIIDSRNTYSIVYAHAGYAFNKVLAVEGRWLLDSSDNEDGKTVEGYYGAYLRGTIPIANGYNAYLLYGHSWHEVGLQDKSSSSMGLGIKYHVAESWAITCEVVELSDGIDLYAAGFSLVF